MTSLRHPRHLAVAVLGLSLALAGCSATNEITTDADYDASDGVGLELGEVELTNILVVTATEGSPGTVLGAVTNRGGSATDVTIGLVDQAGTVLAVPAGATVLLGPDGEAVELDAVPAPPGALVTLAVDSDEGGSTTLQVPVLDGTLPEYADLVP
ncbi:MAG TPA: hypothetical protein VN257_09205 [Actinotalea sp.]|nr:hypothetical protein [Actinotalea sp.]